MPYHLDYLAARARVDDLYREADEARLAGLARSARSPAGRPGRGRARRLLRLVLRRRVASPTLATRRCPG